MSIWGREQKNRFRPLLFGRDPISVSKKVQLATDQRPPNIIENITEVDILNVEENRAF